ncbi:response regulator [Pseudonocardia pini]|uniref:response regulator n=1 Tax=Pseudonocardia pini TaxID=2758030 RepID=UPI0015F0ABE8|nr:response regulator transcription factor [Pseudonocardia pini]
MTVRVVLVDDHPLFRDGVAGLLRATGHEVVGIGGTGEEAVALAADLRPDVLVLDLHMPGGGGVEATRRVRAADPDARILVLTMDDADARVVDAVRAGARGYLLKESEPEELVAAIAAVARGEAVFGSALAGRLADWFTVGRAEPFGGLTARERDVLGLVARGLGNAAIAERLGLAPKTVRNLVSTVLVKLQVTDRSAAIVKAREAGLG